MDPGLMMKKTKRLFKKMLLIQHPPMLHWNPTMLNHKEQTKKKVWLLCLISKICKDLSASCHRARARSHQSASSQSKSSTGSP